MKKEYFLFLQTWFPLSHFFTFPNTWAIFVTKFLLWCLLRCQSIRAPLRESTRIRIALKRVWKNQSYYSLHLLHIKIITVSIICAWRVLTLTMPVFTWEYELVVANCLRSLTKFWGNLQVTGIPSWGSCNIPSRSCINRSINVPMCNIAIV